MNPQAAPVYPQNVRPFPGRENCDYNDRGFTCKVPPGHYFMMGDNRDNSDDSRYWGFVPDDHIRGKAFFIWFNWDDISSLRVQARRQRHSMSAGARGPKAMQTRDAARSARVVDDRLPVRRRGGASSSRSSAFRVMPAYIE